jgi:transposase
MNRKIWSADEKLVVVLEILKGEASVTEICLRHQVAVSQAYHWRDLFLEHGKKAFIDRRHKNNDNHLLEENRHLKELVGSLSLIIDAQKKFIGH